MRGACFPATGALIRESDKVLKKILIEGERRVHYPRCSTPGSLSPVGRAGSAGACRRKCRARVGESGCKILAPELCVCLHSRRSESKVASIDRSEETNK